MGNKILVVDDDKDIGRFFEKELGNAGYKVDSALNAEIAVGLAKSNKYDLIFVDFVLPGDMNGVKICEAIKEISPDSQQIFMTGVIDKDLPFKEMAFQNAGGNIYYLYKPFIKGEILEITKKALAERR